MGFHRKGFGFIVAYGSESDRSTQSGCMEEWSDEDTEPEEQAN
jgi:hypothetical protein